MLLNTQLIPAVAAISAENLTLAWQTPLLGMAMVFAVLGMLWAILSVFKLVFVGKSQKKVKEPKKQVSETKTVKQEEKAVAVEQPAPVVNTAGDAELIAVITAAVAAYMSQEGTEYTGGFRVVSFKRVRGGRTWNTK